MANAVEVVRCKDCGYYNVKGGFCLGLPGEPIIVRPPDGFCNYGVERTIDNEELVKRTQKRLKKLLNNICHE